MEYDLHVIPFFDNNSVQTQLRPERCFWHANQLRGDPSAVLPPGPRQYAICLYHRHPTHGISCGNRKESWWTSSNMGTSFINTQTHWSWKIPNFQGWHVYGYLLWYCGYWGYNGSHCLLNDFICCETNFHYSRNSCLTKAAARWAGQEFLTQVFHCTCCFVWALHKIMAFPHPVFVPAENANFLDDLVVAIALSTAQHDKIPTVEGCPTGMTRERNPTSPSCCDISQTVPCVWLSSLVGGFGIDAHRSYCFANIFAFWAPSL